MPADYHPNDRMILFALAENSFDGIHENYFGMRHTVTHHLTRPLLHRGNIDERIANGAIGTNTLFRNG